jgi:two-component system osmolarity sensor histidine kinase EnvZ
LIVITPVVVIQLISGYVFFERHWEHTTKVLAQSIAGDIALASHMLAKTSPGEEAALLKLLFRTTRLTIKVIPPPQVCYQSWPFQSRLERALHVQLDTPYILHVNPQIARVWLQVGERFFCFSFPTKRLFSHTTPLWLFWSLAASFFFAFLASFFMRRQIRPLQELALVAEGLEEGQTLYTHRIRGAKEIRQIGHMFSLMQRRLLEQIEGRAAFLAGISHDLRTPLTRMRLQLALMPPSDDLDALTHDLDQLIHMVEDYLDFIRKEHSPQPQNIHLKPFFEMLLKSFHPPRVPIVPQVPENLWVTLGLRDLRRCLQNVLENALRYAQSQVVVSVEQEGDEIVMRVDDDGPGIAPAFYAAVFKPFFRIDSGRNLQTGGTGLGLAIVDKLTKKLQGRVALSPSPLSGLRVTLRFPLGTSSSDAPFI